MHDIVIAEAGMNRAQEGVNQSFHVLGANGGQSYDFYAPILAILRRETTSAIGGNPMAFFDKACADFFVTGFDPAVFADYASTADERNAQTQRFVCPGSLVCARSF